MRALYVFLVLTVTSLPACAADEYPATYAAEAIEARVVDADTKQPLEGVIVTANWELVGGFEGNTPVGQMKVLETVTGKDGKFTFPAWGPEPRKKGYLRNRDPQLLLFKPGYEYQRHTNEVSSKPNMASLRRSDWNGKTVELKPFKGTIEAYENQFESLNRDLERFAVDKPEECGWKKIPDMVRAMNRERKRLVAQGINPHTLSSLDKELLMNDEYYTKKGGCGSPKAFFEDLQQ